MSTDTALTVPTRFLEADGIRFAYRRWGKPGAVATGRRFKQHFFGFMRFENGEIKLLREAINIVATAQAFFPNRLADLAPLPVAGTSPDAALAMEGQ
jgi:hypothetical protein